MTPTARVPVSSDADVVTWVAVLRDEADAARYAAAAAARTRMPTWQAEHTRRARALDAGASALTRLARLQAAAWQVLTCWEQHERERTGQLDLAMGQLRDALTQDQEAQDA